MTKSVIIIGSSGHSKVVIDIIENDSNYTIVGLIDDFKRAGEVINKYETLGKLSDINKLFKEYNTRNIFIAIGDNYSRYKVYKSITEIAEKPNFINVIHKSSIILTNIKKNDGIFIGANTVINIDSKVSKHTLINTSAIIEHDAFIGAFSSLGPNSVIAGASRIGFCSSIGLSAGVLEKRAIGDNTVIGAGAIVTKDIESKVVAIGIPARVVRNREVNDKYLL